GCCALAPVMVIDAEVFGSMTAAKVNRTLRKYRKQNSGNKGRNKK
ncbi:MAG: NAD(P)H-dependent oxidoreductase subunit E, partial [Candidatus Heimdallarchaeota archaeon]